MRGFAQLPEHMGGYVQLNASALGWRYRPSADFVPSIQAILVDLDPLPGELGTSPLDADIVEDALINLGVWRRQMQLVYSGRGYQWWILLDHAPVELAARIPTFLRRVAERSQLTTSMVDLSCADLPRLARMPGTVNPRTGRKAEFISGVKAQPALWPWLLDCEPLPPPPPIEVPAISSLSWQVYFYHLTLSARKYILEGCEKGRRHQQAFATAASLHDVGAAATVAFDAVAFGNDLCSEPLSPVEIRHAVATAYRREPNQ